MTSGGSGLPDHSTTLPFRPPPDEVVPTTAALRWQATRCRDAGAPVAGAILDAVAEDLEGPRRLDGLLPAEVRAGDQIGLRTMAVVHRLALSGRAPAVAAHLPTCVAAGMGDAAEVDPGEAPGTTGRSAGLAVDVVEALADAPEALRRGLATIPQTNDPGRARPLRAVLARIHLPVRLVELGASAGLNLRADHLRGDPHLEAGALPEIVERVGCDLDPIDPTTADGQEFLQSFVWVDHVDRALALGKAIDVARQVPVNVVTADAAEFAEQVGIAAGTATVVWHSLVWGYLAPATRSRVSVALEAAGRGARPDALLVHAAWEPISDTDDHSGLSVTVWDGSDPSPSPILVATGDHHARSVALTGQWPPALRGNSA